MSKPYACQRRRRPAWFHTVPVKPRADGWTVKRQCAFLAHLYFTGSVTSAARAVGMSRETAYRLRARPNAESFARAWDRVLAPPGTGPVAGPKPDFRKVTDFELSRRYEEGLARPVIYRGQFFGIDRKADDSSLLRLLGRHGVKPAPLPRYGVRG